MEAPELCGTVPLEADFLGLCPSSATHQQSDLEQRLNLALLYCLRL